MAVEAARAAAHADGIEATAVIARAQDVSHAIMQAARDAGLLVVGAHDRSPWRAPCSAAPPRVPCSLMPVLAARARPELGFPGIVVVGTQGIEDRHAALVGATIAARHGTRVVLAHAGRSDPGLRRALAEQAADVLGITGMIRWWSAWVDHRSTACPQWPAASAPAWSCSAATAGAARRLSRACPSVWRTAPPARCSSCGCGELRVGAG